MEVELAAMNDIGYSIDLSKFYGGWYTTEPNASNKQVYHAGSIYGSGTDDNKTSYERTVDITHNVDDGNWFIGLHVYGSNNKITQNANITASADKDNAANNHTALGEVIGIRVDGSNNDLTLASGKTITVDGKYSRGIAFTYGKNHTLTVDGTVNASGADNEALSFNFGDNMLGDDSEYRGSYIRTDGTNNDGSLKNSTLLAELAGPLMDKVDINGTLNATDGAAAIYISQNALVNTINVNSGASITGNIIDNWDRNASFVQISETDKNNGTGITNLNFANGTSLIGDIYTEANEKDSFGNIKRTVSSSLNLNVASGTANIKGSAMVNSINAGGTGTMNISGVLTTTNNSFLKGGAVKAGMLVMGGVTYGYGDTHNITNLTIDGNVDTDMIDTPVIKAITVKANTIEANTIETNTIEADSINVRDKLALANKGIIDYSKTINTSTGGTEESKVYIGTLTGGGNLRVNADVIDDKTDDHNFKVGTIDNARLTLFSNDSSNRAVTYLDWVKEYIQNTNKTTFTNGGSIAAPESLLYGATTWDANGTHEQRGTNDNLAEAASPANSMARVEINDIRKRMGDLRYAEEKSGFWLRNENGALSGTGIDTNFHKWQIGADTKVSDKWHLGAAFAASSAGTSFAAGYNKAKGYSGAVYGMYTGKDGDFADIVARYGTISNDLSFAPGGALQQGSLDQNGFSISGEIGRTIQLKKDFFIEPQAELTYTRTGGDSFTSNDNNYNFDTATSFIGRIGATLGYHRKDTTIYTRVSGLHEFAGDSGMEVTLSNKLYRPFSYDGRATWLEWAIGCQHQVSKEAYIYADIERTFGADINEDYRLNLGFRCSF